MYDGASWRIAGQFAQRVSRLRRVDTCGTVEKARVICQGDDHRRCIAKVTIWGRTKFTIGKIWFGHFGYTNYWVPDSPPFPPLLILRQIGPCRALLSIPCVRQTARGSHVSGATRAHRRRMCMPNTHCMSQRTAITAPAGS